MFICLHCNKQHTMDWLDYTSDMTFHLTESGGIESWTSTIGFYFINVCYTTKIGLFGEELKMNIDVEDSIESSHWNAKLQIILSILSDDPTDKAIQFETTFSVNEDNKLHDFTYPSKDIWLNVGKIDSTTEIKVRTDWKVLESHGFNDITSYTVATRLKSMSDVCLVVENKEIRVNKGFLSTMSEYFCTLFSGNFKESNEEKVELKDISYNEFADFLRILHGIHVEVEEHNYEYLLELSTLFHVGWIKRLCEQFMLEDKSFFTTGNFEERMEALTFSEKYQLHNIQEKLIQSMKTLDDLQAVIKRKEFLELSDKSKAFILQRTVANLSSQTSEENTRKRKASWSRYDFLFS